MTAKQSVGDLESGRPNARRRALRSQDVTQGLMNVDQTSVPVVNLRATRLTGWSASLAASMRDQDIEDLDALRQIAAAHLGIEAFAFDQVIANLQETELASIQRRRDKNVLYVAKTSFETMYDRLGERWAAHRPTEFDNAIITTIDQLATAPLRETRLEAILGGDKQLLTAVLSLGEDSQLIKLLGGEADDRFIYTPYQAFERLDVLPEVLASSGDEDLRAGFASIKAYQGLPLSKASPTIQAAVRRGLLLAPTVNGISGEHAFVTVPYKLPRVEQQEQKVILDKALAILAAVRYGEHFGRSFKIKWPELVLAKLADATREHELSPHPELARQYQALATMGIVKLVPAVYGMYAVRLIANDDNRRAVAIARDLIQHGELIDERQVPQAEFDSLLRLPQDYRSTLWTMKRQPRIATRIPDKLVTELLVRAQGGAPLER